MSVLSDITTRVAKQLTLSNGPEHSTLCYCHPVMHLTIYLICSHLSYPLIFLPLHRVPNRVGYHYISAQILEVSASASSPNSVMAIAISDCLTNQKFGSSSVKPSDRTIRHCHLRQRSVVSSSSLFRNGNTSSGRGCKLKDFEQKRKREHVRESACT